MNKKTDFEISLLGPLVKRPMHGYHLHKELSDESPIKYIYKIKIANLYAILNKLEKLGWIESVISQEGNRPQRKLYNLTDSGKYKFFEWLDSPVSRGRDLRVIFLMKLFYGMNYQPEKVGQLVKNQKDVCKNWSIKSEAVLKKEGTFNEPFLQYIFSFRQHQINSYLEYLHWCEEKIIMEKK